MKAWEDFLLKQEELLGKDVVQKWLRPLHVAHFDSANLYLEAKDSFLVAWFEEHIRPLIKKHLLNSNFRPIKVHLTVVQTPGSVDTKNQKKSQNKERVPELVFSPDPLLPNATLDRFIVSDSNQVIYRLLNEVVEKPHGPASFNPIYLWGESGTGKTHLLMGVAQALKQKGLIALYARTETFTEHVVSAIRASEMQHFRKAYRHVDVLLIDDVHLLARKMATQEEFFHTFNALHMAGKQIILTANCSPLELREIEPRLVSRFEWGINLHLEKNQLQELSCILKDKCLNLQFPLSDEVQNFLLQHFPSNATLSQAFDALILRCHLDENKIQPELLQVERAKKMLADLIEQELSHVINEEKILAIICAHFEIAKIELLGKSQKQEHSLPRQIAMYLCREQLKMPFAKIGRLFARDHSTVMTSTKQIERRLDGKDESICHHIASILRFRDSLL